jgi:tetratricopeptide (TPR) repeat protein
MAKLKELYKEQDSLLRQVKLLTEERESLKKVVESMAEVRKDLKEGWEDLGKLDQENRGLKELIAKAEEELVRTQAKLSQVEKELEQEKKNFRSQKSLRNELKRKSSLIKQLRGQRRIARQQIAQLDKENRSLRADIQASTLKITQNLKALKAVQDKRDYYKSRIDTYKKKAENAVKELASAHKREGALARQTATMHYNLGNLCFSQRKYEQAIAEYNQALGLPESHYNLGIIYSEYLKDNQKAVEHFRQYLNLEPSAAESKKIEEQILHLECQTRVLK